jgi:GTP cyclohydrolase I
MDTKTLELLFRGVLNELDPNPHREGLYETPARVAKAFAEWCGGYAVDTSKILRTFEDGAHGYDELVIQHCIPFRSLCEHHLAPFEGIAHVGYLPGERIVGLSKLVRMVDAYARRLQVQERITTQIASRINEDLKPLAVGVIIRASHSCISSRGVRVHGSSATTSAMLGLLRTEASLRAEFVSLCDMAERREK